MDNRFEYRPGARFNVTAAVAGEELERIAERDGEIRTATVVDEARPDDAPLHPVFEWDDEIAAESYRRHQARHLIRSVRVIERRAEQRDPVVIPFVHVRSHDGRIAGGYQSLAVVAKDPDLFQRALLPALQKSLAAEQAVAELRAVAESEPESVMARLAVSLEALSMVKSTLFELRH